jgi:hypothetical protein
MTFPSPKKDKDVLGRLDIVIIIVTSLIGLSLRLISFNLSTEHDADVGRFITRSELVLSGRVSYRDFSDPKPLWTHTLAAWFYLFGIKVESLFLLLIIVDAIAVLFMFLVGKDILGKKAGYLASLFYAFNPFTIFFSSTDGKMDTIPVLFALVAFWFLKKRKIDLSAIFLGIGIMFKYLAGLYLIPFLFIIRKSWNRSEMMIRYVVECAVTFALIALPFLLISPSLFIEDTFLFFITKEMQRWQHPLHPYNFLPFYIPLIFVCLAWIGIIYLAASIDNFDKGDELRLLFFFIMFTVLLNRSVFIQYFMYAIPILGLIFAQDLVIDEAKKWSISWVTISACVISFFLGIELLGNFGIKEQQFLSLLGNNSQSSRPLSLNVSIHTILSLGIIFAQDLIKCERSLITFSRWTIATKKILGFPILEFLNNSKIELLSLSFLTADWIGDLVIVTYFGIFFFTLVLFIDWIRNLKRENRLQLSRVLKISPLGKFLKKRITSDSTNKTKINRKPKDNG